MLFFKIVGECLRAQPLNVSLEESGSTTTKDVIQQLLKHVAENSDEEEKVLALKILRGGELVFQTNDVDSFLQTEEKEDERNLVADGTKNKFLVILTSKQAVEQLAKSAAAGSDRIRNDLDNSSSSSARRKAKISPSPSSSSSIQSLQKFGFLRIVPLQAHELPSGIAPRVDEAMSILTRLSQDRGVLAVMKKYNWTVHLLTEFAPSLSTGLVGFSSTCLMGYNQNKGEKIALRLRTSDFEGFQRFQDTRETLFHELAHMQYSEHSAEFWALYRQLLREGEAMDWTKSKGHVLETTAFHRRDGDACYGHNEDADDDAEFQIVRVLDEEGRASDLHRLMPASEMARIAAQSRFVRDNNDDRAVVSVEEIKNGDEEDEAMHDVVDDGKTKQEETTTNEEKQLIEPMEDGHSSPQERREEEVEIKGEDTAKATTMTTTTNEKEKESESIPNLPPDHPKSIQIQKALEKIASDAAPDWAGVHLALDTLSLIVRNVLQHPSDAKYRKLRLDNPGLQHRVARFAGCRDLLLALQFSYVGDNRSSMEMDSSAVDLPLLDTARSMLHGMKGFLPAA